VISGVVFSYSDVFDRQPTHAELIALVETIPLRHAAFVISRINMALRFAMQEHDRPNFGKVQEMLVAGHIDDEILGILKKRFPTEKCDERPVFLPNNLLNVLRIVVTHCDPIPPPKIEEDESVRYAIGRACLMMNSLLFTEDEGRALKSGTEDERRTELMTQTIAGFELTNSPKSDHLMPRLQVMYRILLRDPSVKSRIALECEGFDFERAFNELAGMPLERWLFVIFAIYVYFLQGANPFESQPEYMLINPALFCGESGITRAELDIVLATISIPIAELKSAIESETYTDPRHDFVAFRSRPLLRVEQGKLLPVDLAFVLEKCHTGVQWTIHDELPIKRRQTVFNAWGVLFEEYVHWLFEGMKTDLPIKYIRAPKWKDTKDESFDGILLQGDVLVPAEYKGGFLSRGARYSGNSKALIGELNKKFATGCDQLADKIGALFTEDDAVRKQLEELPLDHFRSIVPVLVLQDHIFRVPFLNWYLNKQFQERLRRYRFRTGVFIRPLTVVPIHDLESMVHSAEGANFDFIYALHHRTIRDEHVLSDLIDTLGQFPQFGKSPSPRIKKALEDVQSDLSSYLFPSGKQSPDSGTGR
jgi:hypothetical protein